MRNTFDFSPSLAKKSLLFFFLMFIGHTLNAQITLCSWNLENFGKSKTDSVISYIADIVEAYDVIAIQEVVAGDGGAQAVARLHDELDTKGFKWDYAVSNPTISSSYKTERYAFIWKTSKVEIVGKAWLEKKYNLEIDREPFLATFKADGKLFTVVNFHAITKLMQPETEIKYLKFLPDNYPGKNLIFCGDFNCPQYHTVFNPLKTIGYIPILKNQKTSLREKCINDDCLSSEFDNMFYNSSKNTLIEAGVRLFYKGFLTFEEARLVSDHLPIYFKFLLR